MPIEPKTKSFALICAYSMFLWITNWSYTKEGDQSLQSLDLRGLGAVIGLLVSVILAKRVWELIRELLDAGFAVPRATRLCGSWSTLWLLLPLLFSYTEKFGEVTFQYGGGNSWLSFFFSAVAIMLFQFLVNLGSIIEERR